MTTMTLEDVNLADPGNFVAAVPHDMFAVLRREAPVWFHPSTDDTEGFWCIVKYADLVELSRDYPHASSELGGITLNDMTNEDLELQRQMMLMMDPPKHTKLRLLVNKGFTPRMIGRLDERIRETTRGIIDEVAARGECDFVVDMAAELPLQVIAEMMGVPQSDRHKIFEWSNRLIGSEDPEYNVSREEAIGAATEMFMYSTELAESKRANPGDDIISTLLQAEVEGTRLTDAEFNLFFQLLAVAGNETTRNLISNGMQFLFEHPDQRAKLAGDRSLLPGAIDEMLRYASPVMYMGAPRRRISSYAVRRSTPATRSPSGTSRPTVTKRCSTTRTPSTSRARPTTTSPSAAAGRTSASAPTWPSSRSGRCSRRSSTGFPT